MKAHSTARVLLLLLFAAAPVAGQRTAPPDRVRVAAAVDSIVGAALGGGRLAGLSVAVVRGRDTLVLRGYGKADLELDVPTPPAAVYEIGSVTKQFTAAAIYKLAEQGKLSLDDEVRKFFPDFPTGGRHITLRHLLAHTSGLRSYTDLPSFGTVMTRAAPPDSMRAFIASAPWDFAPGEAMAYNNSGFMLLGWVIEKASGLSYSEYMKKNIFAPAGMVATHVCDDAAVVPRRVRGYVARGPDLSRPMFIALTWPFSAGALCSTAGDLVAWARALHGGRMLGPAAYAQYMSPSTLADGTRLRYAKGLVVDSAFGRRTVYHGGAIPGFLSYLEYFPDDTLTVVVLANTMGPVAPVNLARAIEGVLFPSASAPSGRVWPFHGKLADYTGEYRGPGEGEDLVAHVLPDMAAHLTIRIGEAPPATLEYLGRDTFRLPDNSRFTFVREKGVVTALRADLRYAYSVMKRK